MSWDWHAHTMQMEWQGIDTLRGILAAAPANASDALRDAIWQTMMYVFTLSQLQVPVRTGVLKGSGHVEEDGDAVVIGYGGPSAGYALWVHENLAAQHKAPTKAKYLEDPMKEAVPHFIEIMGDDRLSAAILGQYPTSPARAAQADMTRDIGRAYRGRRPPIAHAPAMTPKQVHAALGRIAHGARGIQRARTR